MHITPRGACRPRGASIARGGGPIFSFEISTPVMPCGKALPLQEVAYPGEKCFAWSSRKIIRRIRGRGILGFAACLRVGPQGKLVRIVAADWKLQDVGDEAAGLAQVAGSIDSLVSSLCAAFEAAQSFEPAWELLEADDAVGRSVVQFKVAPNLFDLVFNEPLGYRGMYRRGPWTGASVNSLMVAKLKAGVAAKVPKVLDLQVLRSGPSLDGRKDIDQATFLRSLDPALSKVWYCTAEIRPNEELRLLPSGVSATKLEVGRPNPWAVLRQSPDDCIIEVKGAFVGPHGLFQVKDPERRGAVLSERGEA